MHEESVFVHRLSIQCEHSRSYHFPWCARIPISMTCKRVFSGASLERRYVLQKLSYEVITAASTEGRRKTTDSRLLNN